ncbi:MAG: OmpA family protein [Bacteroidetes bacterium]|nr:OmpA family protein [Bacteroidota bacterium]
MKKIIIPISLVFTSTLLSQQKIELKPGTATPPCSYNQIGFAQGFSNPNNGTTELFGKNGKSDFAIPANYMGTQDAIDGDYYFGIITYKGDRTIDLKSAGNGGIVVGKPLNYNYSEYVQASIPQALTAGKEYEFIFKVSLADNSAFATKGFGVYLSDKQVSENTNKQLTLKPQVTYPELVTDKTGWTELKAKFKATGTEKFAVIGCFPDNYAVESVSGGKSSGTIRAYYYISAISIVEAPKPDRDKDGITDDIDACPDVAGIVKFQGCPDTDGDGIADKDDACPNESGLAQFQGCPDTDGDGIIDNKDKCPKVAGVATNAGCPEVKISEKAKEVFQKAMTGIQFETGKDVIKKSSFPILDNVVTILKENPDWNVEVQGHTDNVGKYESNKKLSHKRAEAVEKYLEDKGINADKIRGMGYGSDRPIADNKTPAGRAKNRRVEFNVTYER